MNSPNSADILGQGPSCFDPASGNQPSREKAQHPRGNGQELDAGQGAEDLEYLPFGRKGLEGVGSPRVLLDEAHLVGETGEHFCKVKR